ncbi:hypothetical protein [Anabaenopsis elenkinii]|uniref:Uncharacterized protein n=1 Tax=Anabaenopsis elenkinii CCIBt3563 TaxID=2779889 RepID=A0A7S6RKB8_9CYAN|nr:hypothetical protein [Anabaenopsis elenkinii]QOV24722.1 hypothetical protein IM676_14020 [Anabaenopsis elenkinii CCIBt3563]
MGLAYISDYLSEQKPVVRCQQWVFQEEREHKHYTYPDKLVVQPWRGRHHVYAIFLIPVGYEHDGLFTLTIPGSSTHCGRSQKIGKVVSGVDDTNDYNRVRGFLNTRIAVQFILQGKLSQLREPQNWRLGYSTSKGA